jgi:hypothetical protein
MQYGPSATQPLVVTGNALIQVNAGATINFNDVPLPGNTTVQAVINADGRTESIYVESGESVYSDGNWERVVGMGVSIYSGTPDTAILQVDAGNASKPLDFTGQNIGGVGLVTTGGIGAH